MDYQRESKIAKKVTFIGIFVNILLGIFKVIAGIYGNSRVLLADGIHSFSDLTTDIAVLVGIKYWSTPADDDHPYGHMRIESIVTGFIGIILMITGIGIAYNSITDVFGKHEKGPELIALIAAVISILFKEALYRWTIYNGKKIESTSVVANAWHHRSDALSSIPAVVSVVISMSYDSLIFVDYIGAFLVSLFIIKVSIDILKQALMNLSDRSAPKKYIDKIDNIAMEVEGVKEVHKIRTRRCGKGYFVDLHVLVDGNMSVYDGHTISKIVKELLLKKEKRILDVVVHLEPYETSSIKKQKNE